MKLEGGFSAHNGGKMEISCPWHVWQVSPTTIPNVSQKTLEFKFMHLRKSRSKTLQKQINSQQTKTISAAKLTMGSERVVSDINEKPNDEPHNM